MGLCCWVRHIQCSNNASVVFNYTYFLHNINTSSCTSTIHITGYYDKNIMPLLSVLNLVSISILTQDADNDFQRSLLALNIAFVEVGLRMALDSHLPSVGYQIKLQRILNFFFYSILAIVLESSILKFLIENEICSISFTRKVDLVMVIFLLLNQAYLSLIYTSFHGLRQTTEKYVG